MWSHYSARRPRPAPAHMTAPASATMPSAISRFGHTTAGGVPATSGSAGGAVSGCSSAIYGSG